MTRAEAKAVGEKFYTGGKPCKHGHAAPRHTSNAMCAECLKIAKANDYQKHRARRYAVSRKWIDDNKESYDAWKREYYEKNKKQILEGFRRNRLEKEQEYRERAKQYRVANRDAILAKKAAYYAANRERHFKNTAKWCAENKAARKAIVNNYRARKKASPGTYTGADIEDIFKSQKRRCAMCKSLLRARYHADHIMPLKLGGTNDRRNIQLLCVSCNCSKNARHPIDFARSRGLLL